MSKARSAIKDKIEFVNFQVKLILLLINIMGFCGGSTELLQIYNKMLEFLLNHYKNILIFEFLKSLVGGPNRLVGGGAWPPRPQW